MKWHQRLLKLLGSMPFAVAVLAIVAVAASIGSLVEQNQPLATDVGNFGLLWADSYRLLGLIDVYHAPWFLTLLAFLTFSTGLCVWRNTPVMWREWKTYKSQLALDQLRRLPVKAEVALDVGLEARVLATLRAGGWRWRGQGLTLSAKKGQLRRLGYVFTHLAIVVISVGGLIDGNLGLQLQRSIGQVSLAPMDQLPGTLPAASRLGPHSGAFRGALRLAEGEQGDSVSLQLGDGYLQRQLPVTVSLTSFKVHYHPGGQPRDFVSEIEVREDGGPVHKLHVAMNEPARFGTLTFYQSGFDDGGSRFSGQLLLDGGLSVQSLAGQVGQQQALLINGQPSTLEATGYKPRNLVVTRSDTDTRSLQATFLAGRQVALRTDLGPTLDVSLLDAAGQLLSQTIYTQGLTLDGRQYRVVGLRRAGEGERFLRLPLDATGSLNDYRALLLALRQPALLTRFTALAPHGDVVREALSQALGQYQIGGLGNVGDIGSRPVLIELLSRMALQAWVEQHPQQPPASGLPFVADSLLAYSHWIEAARPALVQVDHVEPHPASVLQVSEAPGAAVVYVGMAMLALGVVLMVLLPERRLWLRPTQNGLLLAMAAHRPLASLTDELAAFINSMKSTSP